VSSDSRWAGLVKIVPLDEDTGNDPGASAGLREDIAPRREREIRRSCIVLNYWFQIIFFTNCNSGIFFALNLELKRKRAAPRQGDPFNFEALRDLPGSVSMATA
jgi:hypothetical protein